MSGVARDATLAILLTALGLPAHAFAAQCRSTTVPTPTDFSPSGSTCWSQGVPLVWSRECVGLRLRVREATSLAERDVSDSFRRAIATWTVNVVCPGGGSPSISLALQGSTATDVGYSTNACNENSLVMTSAFPPGSSESLVLPILTFDKDSGEIFDADLLINGTANLKRLADGDAAIAPTDAIDLDSTMIHAVGHLLGAAHAADPNDVMYGLIIPGEVRRTLLPDNLAFVCGAYPPSGMRELAAKSRAAEACDYTPRRGSCEGTCSSAIGRGCNVAPDMSRFSELAVGAALGAVAWARIRKRRRLA